MGRVKSLTYEEIGASAAGDIPYYNGTAYEAISPRGVPIVTTLPADDTTHGAIVEWQRTNGRWQMRWDGSEWIPWATLGPCTVYVDTSGTNDQDHGDGTGSDAFADLQYAWMHVPKWIDPDSGLVISMANQTWTPSGYLSSPKFHGGSVTVRGTPVYQLQDEVVSAVVTGRRGTITTTTGGLTVNAHTNHIVQMKTCAGGATTIGRAYGVVSNTATVLTLANVGTPVAANDTFDLLSKGTKISGGGTCVLYTGGSRSVLRFEHIHFDNMLIRPGYTSPTDDTGVAQPIFDDYTTEQFDDSGDGSQFVACWVDGNTSGSVVFARGPNLTIEGCIIAGGNYATTLLTFVGTRGSVTSCRVLRTAGTKTGTGIYALQGRASVVVQFTDTDNFATGITAQSGSYVDATSCTVTNNTNGISVAGNSTFFRLSMSYSGNTTNEAAAATSGVYI